VQFRTIERVGVCPPYGLLRIACGFKGTSHRIAQQWKSCESWRRLSLKKHSGEGSLQVPQCWC